MNRAIYISWFQSVVAVIASLLFDNVFGIPPCPLCWYQRICMFPLAVILSVGLMRRNKEIHLYVLPLSLTGLLISLYHNLLYFGVFSKSVISCAVDVSCTAGSQELFGFITIPLLFLLAFLVITLCCWYNSRVIVNNSPTQ